MSFFYACSFFLLLVLTSCSPSPQSPPATLPPEFKITLIGNSTSTIPNIYRDGGGGGRINNLNFVVFADGSETSGGYPRDDNTNLIGFQSNSIVYSGYQSLGPQNFQDFGTNGIPKLFVPFWEDEDPSKTAIWPNSNIVTLCGGSCGVAFYPVVNRSTCPACMQLYSTGVNITVGAFGPSAVRPVKALFKADEVNYGLFSGLVGIDGYLYLFGSISGTSSSNGLKMARVPSSNPFDRTYYEYWSGTSWSTAITEYDDGGTANIFNYTTLDLNGHAYGPSSGDLFYSPFYNVYMLIFQAIGIDNSVYLSYSSSLETGWSKPVVLFEMPTLEGGYDYNIHAYPGFGGDGRVVPVSWTQYATYENPTGVAYYNAWANITFS